MNVALVFDPTFTCYDRSTLQGILFKPIPLPLDNESRIERVQYAGLTDDGVSGFSRYVI